MFERQQLRGLLVAAGLAVWLSGCASKCARFQTVPAPNRDVRTAFETTEKVLGRYFTEMPTRRPDQGLICTEQSHARTGDLAEDAHRIRATALVEPQGEGSVVHVKLQRTKVVSRWSWLGLGTTYYEKELLTGADELLTAKIQADLAAALAAPPAAAEKPSVKAVAPKSQQK